LSIIFDLERTNQLSLLPDKDLVDLCPPIEPYQVTKNPKEVAMKEIKQIEFQGKVIIKSGELVIRGEEKSSNPKQNRQSWTEPLQNFKIIDVNEGKAEVTLTSLDSPKIRGIERVALNSSYVVEEIKFNPSDKIEIQVNPH
jgi:hypothetical protein